MLFWILNLKKFSFKINARKWTLKVTCQELIEIKTPPDPIMPMW
jgi:hypothetical protein